ncbi:MAG: hypothetical protein QOE76_4252 [Frankiales bacterium]|nr:hypothetical protein [Frankiales bacterium]
MRERLVLARPEPVLARPEPVLRVPEPPAPVERPPGPVPRAPESLELAVRGWGPSRIVAAGPPIGTLSATSRALPPTDQPVPAAPRPVTASAARPASEPRRAAAVQPPRVGPAGAETRRGRPTGAPVAQDQGAARVPAVAMAPAAIRPGTPMAAGPAPAPTSSVRASPAVTAARPGRPQRRTARRAASAPAPHAPRVRRGVRRWPELEARHLVRRPAMTGGRRPVGGPCPAPAVRRRPLVAHPHTGVSRLEAGPRAAVLPMPVAVVRPIAGAEPPPAGTAPAGKAPRGRVPAAVGDLRTPIEADLTPGPVPAVPRVLPAGPMNGLRGGTQRLAGSLSVVPTADRAQAARPPVPGPSPGRPSSAAPARAPVRRPVQRTDRVIVPDATAGRRTSIVGRPGRSSLSCRPVPTRVTWTTTCCASSTGCRPG